MSGEKACNRCGAVKPIEQFSRNAKILSGRVGHCKECQSDQDRAYRVANTERIALNSKAYQKANSGRIQRQRLEYRMKNSEQIHESQRQYRNEHFSAFRAAIKAWSKTEAGRAANMAYQRRRRAEHPEKDRARAAVKRAVKAGRIVKFPCQVCGEANTHAHHEDYSKPLDVQWLCPLHHRLIHGMNR